MQACLFVFPLVPHLFWYLSLFVCLSIGTSFVLVPQPVCLSFHWYLICFGTSACLFVFPLVPHLFWYLSLFVCLSIGTSFVFCTVTMKSMKCSLPQGGGGERGRYTFCVDFSLFFCHSRLNMQHDLVLIVLLVR